jgi:hypothetical protein
MTAECSIKTLALSVVLRYYADELGRATMMLEAEMAIGIMGRLGSNVSYSASDRGLTAFGDLYKCQ